MSRLVVTITIAALFVATGVPAAAQLFGFAVLPPGLWLGCDRRTSLVHSLIDNISRTRFEVHRAPDTVASYRRLVAEVLLQLKYTLLMRIVRITFVIVEDHIGGANAEVRSQGKACVRGNGRLADVHMLQHQVWQQRTATLQAQLDVAARAPVAAKVAEIPSGQRDADLGDVVVDTLHDKAVLCVGGRSGSVPTYRQIVEGTGGRFLHHDGGEEHNPVQLDTSRAAADLVICQTGCISHDTYWRVNDHCKRHGKQCVSWISPVLQASPAACVPFGSCTTHSLASVVPGVCGNPSHPI